MITHEEKEAVSFFLIDFKPSSTKFGSSQNCVLLEEEFEWLRNVFRKSKSKFSYNFENRQVIGLRDYSELMFDVKISYRYNCLIIITSNSAFILDRNSKLLINSFTFKGVVVFTIEDEFDEIYIVLEEAQLKKYKLGQFIRTKNMQDIEPVWIESSTLSNTYAIIVYNGNSARYLVTLDNYDRNLHVFDCDTGKKLNDIVCTIPRQGYALGMTSKKELIVGCDDQILIYEFDEQSFGSGNESLKLIISTPVASSTFYSIIYDELNQRILLSNSDNGSIMVLRKDNLEIILQHNESSENISGLSLDAYTGELLVCITGQISSEILIYK